MGVMTMRIPGLAETLKAKNAKLTKALKKIKKQGCDGPAAYDALDCKTGKIPKKDWCGCCIASAALH